MSIRLQLVALSLKRPRFSQLSVARSLCILSRLTGRRRSGHAVIFKAYAKSAEDTPRSPERSIILYTHSIARGEGRIENEERKTGGIEGEEEGGKKRDEGGGKKVRTMAACVRLPGIRLATIYATSCEENAGSLSLSRVLSSSLPLRLYYIVSKSFPLFAILSSYTLYAEFHLPTPLRPPPGATIPSPEYLRNDEALHERGNVPETLSLPFHSRYESLPCIANVASAHTIISDNFSFTRNSGINNAKRKGKKNGEGIAGKKEEKIERLVAIFAENASR